MSSKIRRAIVKKHRAKCSRANYRKLIANHARANGVPLKLAMAMVEVDRISAPVHGAVLGRSA